MMTCVLQSPSMLSLRGPEFDERPTEREGRLPPIRQDEDFLFQRPELRPEQDYMRSDSRISLTSPESHLPNIESDREDSARYSSLICNMTLLSLNMSHMSPFISY